MEGERKDFKENMLLLSNVWGGYLEGKDDIDMICQMSEPDTYILFATNEQHSKIRGWLDREFDRPEGDIDPTGHSYNPLDDILEVFTFQRGEHIFHVMKTAREGESFILPESLVGASGKLNVGKNCFILKHV